MSGIRRLLYYPGGSGEPRADLAFEEEQLALAANGKPVLVCSSWKSPVLVLGYGQEAESVDLAACRRLGIPVLRRITGGTGVLHHKALSISLALPSSHEWAGSISALYDGFVESLRLALSRDGYSFERGHGHGAGTARRSPICFEDQLTESLLHEGKKVLGCAQARRKKAVLVHGTLLLGLDAGLQAAVFGVEVARVHSAMTALPRAGQDVFEEKISRAIAEGAGLRLDISVTPAAVPPQYLARYSTEHWAPVPPFYQ